MSYYIIETVEKYVVAVGFATEKAAQDFIFANDYMKQHFYRYDIVRYDGPQYVWATTSSKNGVEGIGITFYLLGSWKDSVRYFAELEELPADFDFETDIFEVKMFEE